MAVEAKAAIAKALVYRIMQTRYQTLVKNFVQDLGLDAMLSLLSCKNTVQAPRGMASYIA